MICLDVGCGSGTNKRPEPRAWLAYNWRVNDDPQADLLKHLATISTGASVVVVALRSELASGTVVLSVALLSLSLLISMGALAWKALLRHN
jgi:hypothetical protein